MLWDVYGIHRRFEISAILSYNLNMLKLESALQHRPHDCHAVAGHQSIAGIINIAGFTNLRPDGGVGSRLTVKNSAVVFYTPQASFPHISDNYVPWSSRLRHQVR